jgi:GT2 family glycosyltransferase
MKVFIGVPTSEFGRAAIFHDYLNQLIKPEGTISAGFHTNSGAQNRNLIIEEAMYTQCSHILFIDDDMAFPPNALIQLLERDKDIVGGLYLNRGYPHLPVIFDYDSKTKITRHLLKDHESGLIEVEAVGFGFMLIKTIIFNHLDRPYIRTGQIQKDLRSEDIDFCIRARESGFTIHCDLSLPIGHIGLATFWPNMIDGKWYTAIDTNGNELINTPQLIPINELVLTSK